MRPRFLPLISTLLSLAGCVDPNAPIKTAAGNLSQTQVDSIIESCGGAPGMAIVKKSQLVIYPASDLSITGCVLKALQATGQTTLSRPVGNQRYDTPGKQ